MPLKGNQINRVSMRNNAYEIIKKAIISGDLEPGMRIKDKDLSEQLGISRTPVREAMLRLEDEEFIISKPNSYTIVAPINYTEVKEIYNIVIALETLALQEAAVNPDPGYIEQLEEVNDKYKRSIEEGDSEGSLAYDILFHSLIVSMSNNKELEKIIGRLKDKILRIESFYFHGVSPKQKSLEEHNRIIAGLKERNLAEAVQMLENNWMNSLNHILSKTPKR